MRSELFRIPFGGSVSIGGVDVPWFGFGLLLATWAVIGAALLLWQWRRGTLKFGPGVIYWVVVAAAIAALPQFVVPKGPIPREWPVFGFGLMLFLGFFGAAQLASIRFSKRGLDGEMAWDIAFWGVPAGIIGARLWHIVQYWPLYQGQPWTKFFQLWDGGLVFYGGLITGTLAFVLYCLWRKLNPLEMGDLIMPSLFVGMGFGRLGCFLNGCCYGDFCALPWAVAFPEGSNPYRVQVADGYLLGTEAWSLPLHPTQLYSALDAFLLVAVTLAYYPFRQRKGDVIVLGLAIHAVSRFLIEFVRNDEPGQLGTTFTISQWFSGVMLLGALGLWAWIHYAQPAGLRVEKPAR